MKRASYSCCNFLCMVLAAAYLKYRLCRLSCLPFVWHPLFFIVTHTHTHTPEVQVRIPPTSSECPAITYMAMGFRPCSFPVGGMYVKGIGRLTKVKKKSTRFSFPLLLKRKMYFTNPSCLPHRQRKTSPRSTALVIADSVCNHSSAHAGIPHWSRAPSPPSKLTLAFDRMFGNTRDRFLNEQNHLSYQKLHIRKRLVLLMLLKNR